jgi:hypothetical protein
MPEFIVGFLVGSGWWVIGPLLLLTLIIEHNERHGWTVFFSIITLLVAMTAFSLSWSQVGYVALAYIPIGLVWSLWRWKRRCSKAMKEYDALKMPNCSDDHYDMRDYKSKQSDLRHKVTFQAHIDTIILWVLAWPFSLVEALIGDVIDMVEATIRAIARGTYNRWSNQAHAHFDAVDERRNDPDPTPPEYR